MHLILVLDESGSMSSRIGETVEKTASFLAEQALSADPKDKFTLITFSDSVRRGMTKKLSQAYWDKAYNPKGTTRLNDAVGTAFEVAVQLQSKKVFIAVVTDGEENSSVKYTGAEVKGLMKLAEACGWKTELWGVALGEEATARAAYSLGLRDYAATPNLGKTYTLATNSIAQYRNSP